MSISSLSRETLVHLYTTFNPRRDFRNINLMCLVTSLVKGKTVLDIGSGSGFLLNMLSEQGKKAFGIEPLTEMIKISKKRYPTLSVYQGYAEDIEKIFPHLVDSVIMTDVLEHIKDDGEQLKKISKKIYKYGQIIIVVPAYQFLYGERDRQLGHYRRYSSKILKKILKESDFRVVSIRYWNMLGVLPYFFSEKVLGKPLNTSLRSGVKIGLFKKILQSVLYLWFKFIENNVNFGFGLSIICVAEKKD